MAVAIGLGGLAYCTARFTADQGLSQWLYWYATLVVVLGAAVFLRNLPRTSTVAIILGAALFSLIAIETYSDWIPVGRDTFYTTVVPSGLAALFGITCLMALVQGRWANWRRRRRRLRRELQLIDPDPGHTDPSSAGDEVDQTRIAAAGSILGLVFSAAMLSILLRTVWTEATAWLVGVTFALASIAALFLGASAVHSGLTSGKVESLEQFRKRSAPRYSPIPPPSHSSDRSMRDRQRVTVYRWSRFAILTFNRILAAGYAVYNLLGLILTLVLRVLRNVFQFLRVVVASAIRATFDAVLELAWSLVAFLRGMGWRVLCWLGMATAVSVLSTSVADYTRNGGMTAASLVVASFVCLVGIGVVTITEYHVDLKVLEVTEEILGWTTVVAWSPIAFICLVLVLDLTDPMRFHFPGLFFVLAVVAACALVGVAALHVLWQARQAPKGVHGADEPGEALSDSNVTAGRQVPVGKAVVCSLMVGLVLVGGSVNLTDLRDLAEAGRAQARAYWNPFGVLGSWADGMPVRDSALARVLPGLVSCHDESLPNGAVASVRCRVSGADSAVFTLYSDAASAESSFGLQVPDNLSPGDSDRWCGNSSNMQGGWTNTNGASGKISCWNDANGSQLSVLYDQPYLVIELARSDGSWQVLIDAWNSIGVP